METSSVCIYVLKMSIQDSVVLEGETIEIHTIRCGWKPIIEKSYIIFNITHIYTYLIINISLRRDQKMRILNCILFFKYLNMYKES